MLRTILTFVTLLLAVEAFGFDFVGYNQGENIGDQFGEAFCQLDLNGDGFLDLAVAAAAADDNGLSSGKVYIYYGGASLDTNADLELTGDASSFFGKALASAGDFNNDGYEDLLVGAPFYDLPAVSAGAVYLFYGGATPDNTVDHVFTGVSSSDYFGISICGGIDFNNDGFDDIAIGSYKSDWGLFDDAGKVYLYYGGNSPDFALDKTLVGSADGERFGYSLACADFDGDTHGDIAVGAYSYDAAEINVGRIYLFNGGSSPDSLADLTITGDLSGVKYGWELSSGLINEDIYADLIMGTDTYPVDTFDAGKVFVYHGSEVVDGNEDDSYLLGRSEHDYFGYSVSSGVNYDLSGGEDIFVGAPGYDDGGAAFLFSEAGGMVLDTTFEAAVTGEDLGYEVIVWKYNSGSAAPVIGAPNYDQNRGRIYIYNLIVQQEDICGDVNGDGLVNILDILFLVEYKFSEGPAPAKPYLGDVNSDGVINILDIIYLIEYKYEGGPAGSGWF